MGITDRLNGSLESIKNFFKSIGSGIKDLIPTIRKSKLVGVSIDPEGKLHAVLSPGGVSIAVSSDESFTFKTAGVEFSYNKEEATFLITGKAE